MARNQEMVFTTLDNCFPGGIGPSSRPFLDMAALSGGFRDQNNFANPGAGFHDFVSLPCIL